MWNNHRGEKVEMSHKHLPTLGTIASQRFVAHPSLSPHNFIPSFIDPHARVGVRVRCSSGALWTKAKRVRVKPLWSIYLSPAAHGFNTVCGHPENLLFSLSIARRDFGKRKYLQLVCHDRLACQQATWNTWVRNKNPGLLTCFTAVWV